MVRIRFAALALGALFLAASCTTDEPTVAPPDETDPVTETGDANVLAADSDLGEILTDDVGNTLYVFLNDEGGESSCTGACAETWPPLAADGDPTAGEGADETLLGTTEREDGTSQVTYNDSPLYLYSGDTAPGDTNGQGVGDVWYVVGPDGEPIQD